MAQIGGPRPANCGTTRTQLFWPVAGGGKRRPGPARSSPRPRKQDFFWDSDGILEDFFGKSPKRVARGETLELASRFCRRLLKPIRIKTIANVHWRWIDHGGGHIVVMLNAVLLSVKNRIESSLRSGSIRDEDWVVMSNLVGNDGLPAGDITEKIVMTVASIQNDASVGAYKAPRQGAGEGFGIAAPPLFLDVYVMFVSCFTGANYAAGLGLLSRVISYLQENPVFEGTASPDIADQMERLAIDFVGLDFAQSSHLATLMGLKGQPFVVYRLRRLPFDGPAISGVAPAVQVTPRPVLERSG